MSKSIILDPFMMFKTLEELEMYVGVIVKNLHDIGDILLVAARMTYDKEFNDLVGEVQGYLNNVGYSTVRAHTKFVTNTSSIVNLLAERFTNIHARNDYSVAAYQEIDVSKNAEDKVHINPNYMQGKLSEIGGKSSAIKTTGNDMKGLFVLTDDFWQGTAADNARQWFNSVTLPCIEELTKGLDDLVTNGQELVAATIKFEASLQTP